MTEAKPAASLDGLPSLLPSTPRPHPARYGKAWSVALFFGDLATALTALAAASAIVGQPLALFASRTETLQAIAFGFVLWLLLFERLGMYARSVSVLARDEVYASLAACALALGPTLALFLLLPSLEPFRAVLSIAAALSVLGIVLVRYAAHGIRSRSSALHRRIAVVGSPERVAAVPRELSLAQSDGVIRYPVEHFDDELAAAGGDLMRLSWLRAAIDDRCNELIITEALPADLLSKLMLVTQTRGITLAFAPTRIRPHACHFRIGRDGGLALLYPQSLDICAPLNDALRRSIDVVLASTAVLLLAPLLAAIACAVACDSGWPVFYVQSRIGRGGRAFNIVKFRTMTVDAESHTGPTWARPREARVTRIGRILRRTSLDELPQLFNVLRGDMAIVGPRPERPFYVEQFRTILPRYDERHLVRPGITGWSHVNMRRNVDTSAIGERLSYDLYYIEHWSLFMDFVIVAKTAFEFLFHSAV